MSYLGLAGFALMILIVALLLWGKSTPAVVFILLPIIVGFAVGFIPEEMSGYIASGVSGVATTAILFIFAVLFFGVMNDAGVFDVIVGNEKKRGAGYNPAAEAETVSVETVAEVNELHRPKLFWFNIALIVAVVLMLTMTKVATHITFMIALAIGLMVNYPSQKMQTERVKAHATDALTMAFTALASGVLIGIMGKSPMLDAMTQMVLSAMPESMAPHLHALFAAVNSPLSMFIHGDALTYGILPIVNQIVSDYGIPAAAVGAAFLITFGPAIYIMPMTAATYMGLGLTNVELKDHIAFSYKWAFVLASGMLAFVLVTGIIPV